MDAPGWPSRDARGDRYGRYRRALGDEALPAALVDLDALAANTARLVAPVRAAGKTLRLATKSIRCPALLERITTLGAGTIAGLMTYTAAETAYLAAAGHRDLLLAYPTVHAGDLAHLVAANRVATAALVVDCEAQVSAAERAAERESDGIRLPLVIDVDLSYRPFGEGGPHLGVRRSPVRSPADVLALGRRIAASRSLRFHGLLGYEAQIAGIADDNPFSRATNFAKRALKRRSAPEVRARRGACVAALAEAGLSPTLVNGGGTGSVDWSAGEAALTEVAAGSGMLDSLLFDHYRGLPLEPAAFFALQVTRLPAPGLYTCHGGGYVASGEAGPDRLPRPYLPEGLTLLPLEGAGEVQTPLQSDGRTRLEIGDVVFFRHAKAGELAEHFGEYLLVEGDRVVERAPTYRGLGRTFLG